MVDRISRQLLLPAITYRTPPAERRAILEGFRSGEITKLVTGRVLNEGVDVPDATVAIVASGSASMREYVQRLGRVLRPKPEAATLYELISRRTNERNAARRRRPARKARLAIQTSLRRRSSRTMLKLTDIRKTTRRLVKDDERASLSALPARPQPGAAHRAGHPAIWNRCSDTPRRELDQEILMQLFGDHKLARCIVACLATSYRYRAQTFGEIVAPELVAKLAAQGIRAPLELRLWLYRRANQTLPGFVGGEERAPFLRLAGAELGVAPEEIETLIGLDDPAQAMLTRIGPIPTADDVRARYNYEVAAALLANAASVRVSLAAKPRDPPRSVCWRIIWASLSR